jgi:DNA gyrase/topoisomerase IV subunit A
MYYLFVSYSTDVYNIKLDSENRRLTAISTKYKKILNGKRKIINQNKKELSRLKTIFEGKAKTLTYIYNKKVDYNLKSNFLNIFARDLVGHGVKLEEMKSEEDTFFLFVVSDDDKKITKYIKYISKKYFDKIKSIDIKRISLSEEDLLYRGILKVSFI